MSGTPEATKQRVWPVLIAAALGLTLLAGLGTWQLQRRAWKDGLIAQIAARTTQAPVSLEEAERRWAAGEDIEYLRVGVSGQIGGGRSNYYFTTGPEGPGYHWYSPFRLSDGRYMLVNLGYVPARMRDWLPTRAPEWFIAGAGQKTIIGLVRASEKPGWFTGSPPPEGKTLPWLTRNLQGMGDRAQISDIVSPKQLIPFFLDIERDARNPEAYPRGGTTRLTLPNRHLEYALTWYGLAATLLVVTGFFLRSRRRGG